MIRAGGACAGGGGVGGGGGTFGWLPVFLVSSSSMSRPCAAKASRPTAFCPAWATISFSPSAFLSLGGGGGVPLGGGGGGLHSLHWLLRRLCSQKAEPPHSLHCFRRRLCWQIWEPPHSLHSLLRRPCSQMLLPPQSLHLERLRLCGQICEPPHSLQVLFMRLCSQMPLPPQSLHEYFWRPCGHLLSAFVLAAGGIARCAAPQRRISKRRKGAPVHDCPSEGFLECSADLTCAEERCLRRGSRRRRRPVRMSGTGTFVYRSPLRPSSTHNEDLHPRACPVAEGG